MTQLFHFWAYSQSTPDPIIEISVPCIYFCSIHYTKELEATFLFIYRCWVMRMCDIYLLYVASELNIILIYVNKIQCLKILFPKLHEDGWM